MWIKLLIKYIEEACLFLTYFYYVLQQSLLFILDFNVYEHTYICKSILYGKIGLFKYKFPIVTLDAILNITHVTELCKYYLENIYDSKPLKVLL